MGNRDIRKKPPLFADDIAVVKRHYDAQSDAYLVMGTHQRPDLKKPFNVVAWHSRHNKKLIDIKTFDSQTGARAHFSAALTAPEAPEHPLLDRDWQKDRLYKWENSFLNDSSARINKKEALALIRRVCKDYNISEPELEWCAAKKGGAAYVIDEHKIYFSDRDAVSLLHELAHAIDAVRHDKEPDSGAEHAPAFVWLAIELYNRYAGIRMDYMIVSANNAGLLGDLQENQMLFSTAAMDRAP